MSGGVEKACQKCGSIFRTGSIKNASIVFLCDRCYQMKRRSTAEREMASKWQHSVISIEDRLITLENQISMIPMLIGAEINNLLLDGGESIESIIHLAIEKHHLLFEHHQNIRQEAFESRMQKQMSTLNNKLIGIMKGMKE